MCSIVFQSVMTSNCSPGSAPSTTSPVMTRRPSSRRAYSDAKTGELDTGSVIDVRRGFEEEPRAATDVEKPSARNHRCKGLRRLRCGADAQVALADVVLIDPAPEVVLVVNLLELSALEVGIDLNERARRAAGDWITVDIEEASPLGGAAEGARFSRSHFSERISSR